MRRPAGERWRQGQGEERRGEERAKRTEGQFRVGEERQGRMKYFLLLDALIKSKVSILF